MMLLHLQVGLTLNIIPKWASQELEAPLRLLPRFKAEHLEPRLPPLFNAEHLRTGVDKPACTPSLNQGQHLASHMMVGIIQFTWIPPL